VFQGPHQLAPAGAVNDEPLVPLLAEVARSAGAVGAVHVQVGADALPQAFELPPSAQLLPPLAAGALALAAEQLAVCHVTLHGVWSPCLALPEPAGLFQAAAQQVPAPVPLHIRLSSSQPQVVRVLVACGVTGTELLDQDCFVAGDVIHDIRYAHSEPEQLLHIFCDL
jgi:hypothetical protein